MQHFFIHFVFLTGLLVSTAMHPIHISVTNLEYYDKKEKFEVTFKLFKDDFEAIVHAKYKQQLNIDKEEEHTEFEKYATLYIEEHFKITTNKGVESKNKLHFVNKKTNHEAIWLYFDIEMKASNEITIKNSLMTDYFEDQRNLLIFTNGEKQNGYTFDYKTRTIKIEM